MRKLGGIFVLILMVLLSASGCYYDHEETLYPQNGCDTANVKYSDQVTYIVSNNCYDCHSNSTASISGSGQSFEGHANLSGYIWGAGNQVIFISSINHVAGYTPMPKDRPKLNDCDIRTLEIWIENGCPNN